MNINNLEIVCKLVKIRDHCEDAISEAQSYLSEQKADPGGIDGFNEGYNLTMAKYNDGSGNIADLTGCYVSIEVTKATIEILRDQIDRINSRLVALKVEV